MLDREHKWAWAWRGGQDHPGLCRPWLVFWTYPNNVSHVSSGPQANAFPVRIKAGSIRRVGSREEKEIGIWGYSKDELSASISGALSLSHP